MEVKDVAIRLGVNDSRVRQLLRAGALRGRHVGQIWLVNADDVARFEVQPRRAGRPLAPPRAWAALALLDGRAAPWLSPSARSQVRARLARLEDPQPHEWLSLLRNRSNVVHASAHPAALERLANLGVAIPAGVDVAVQYGFDLVSVAPGLPEYYVDVDQWRHLARTLAIRDDALDANLIIRLPRGPWPFDESAAAPMATLAADLAESVDPRAASAGAQRLTQLHARWREEHRTQRAEGDT